MEKQVIISSVVMAIDIFSYLIIARIFMSWFRGAEHSEAGKFLINITDPVMKPARRIVPRVGMIDFSPIIIILALNLIQSVIRGL